MIKQGPTLVGVMGRKAGTSPHWEHDVNRIADSPGADQLPRVMEETGFAASSPTTNGRFIAAIFATGDLVCLTMRGKRVWARNLGVPQNHHGHASSLISDDRRLFVQYDQNQGSRLLAFETATAQLDRKAGKVLWEHDFDVGFYSSPILVDDRVYLRDFSGTMQVFKAGGAFELLGTAKIAEDVYATSAFVEEEIFIRGVQHLFCIADPQ